MDFEVNRSQMKKLHSTVIGSLHLATMYFEQLWTSCGGFSFTSFSISRYFSSFLEGETAAPPDTYMTWRVDKHSYKAEWKNARTQDLDYNMEWNEHQRVRPLHRHTL